MTRRVVITGRGAVSCLGNDVTEIGDALHAGRSGIRHMEEWEALSFGCQVSGQPEPWEHSLADFGVKKREITPLSGAGRMGLVAALQAMAEAGLERDRLRALRSSCVVGCGVSDPPTVHDAYEKVQAGRVRRVSPLSIVRCMSNAVSAAVTSVIPVTGLNLTVGSACATGAHAIGMAFDLIRRGAADIAICGGAEWADIGLSGTFDAMRGVLAAGFNDRPEEASRPFDVHRSGFVLSSGSGMLILEARDEALERGVEPRAEILGWGFSSDGHHLTQPDPEGRGAAACMAAAMADAGVTTVDYINAHGTSTQPGDAAELRAIRTVFGDDVPPISSTKSLGGHAVAAAGALEAIHCTEMLSRGFLAPNINLERLDDEFSTMPVIRDTQEVAPRIVMSNSFGFGGTNASLILAR
ncbi:MAG: beta-ketoacyl-[acyl-carrier-protein] synthase family protein [Gemmatimonadota bacterium]